jgi:hypothetical protein
MFLVICSCQAHKNEERVCSPHKVVLFENLKALKKLKALDSNAPPLLQDKPSSRGTSAPAVQPFGEQVRYSVCVTRISFLHREQK